MTRALLRTEAVRLTYFSIALHLVAGAALPLLVGAPIFDSYHQGIESAFWGAHVAPEVRAQQSWWISLFGPTVQAAAL